MADAKNTQRIAYLTSHYPAVSHTFILREIEALKKQGLNIYACSIRRPPASHLTGLPEQNASADTFYVLAAARNLYTLLAAQSAIFITPRRYFSTLRLAWATSAPGMRAHLYQFFYFAEATVLVRHFRYLSITHLHNHFADGSANVAMLTAELADIPFSYTLHGPAELYEPQRWFLHEKTARAKFVACISYFARSQAMYFSDPAHWDKLKIVHCGIEPALYERAKPNPHNTNGMHLVFVGRLTAIKGLRVLLEAFGKARITLPDLRLTLIGDGDDRPHLEKLAAPFGRSVQFTGYQSQDAVAEALAAADVFVLPSFAEGVPVVLMEAMAAAKPVISTLVAGIPELIEDGISGFLVPPGDAETLAIRIDQLANDPGLRTKMGAAGRQKVLVEFNIHTETARIATLFTEGRCSAIRPQPLKQKGID